MAGFTERFDGPGLDPTWLPSYLPAWSSRSAAAATYDVGPAGLRLSIPPEQPLWCPDLHDPPLRVSAVQSGNWSGPVGSTRGQQPFRDGLVVREAQPELRGFTPLHAEVAVTCHARIGPGSMFSAWLVGMEDEPDGVDFLLDGTVTRTCGQSPGYPMMLILGLFDFPRQSLAEATAELVVTTVVGTSVVGT
jgi:hypothetical protein